MISCLYIIICLIGIYEDKILLPHQSKLFIIAYGYLVFWYLLASSTQFGYLIIYILKFINIL